jgi:uncharacterized membrane protein
MGLLNHRFNSGQTSICLLCKQEKKLVQLTPTSLVRNSIYELIVQDHADCNGEGYICQEELNEYRLKYISKTITEEKGHLSSIDRKILENLREQEIISKNLTEEFDKQQKFGARLADRIASFGGSWTFIGLFFLYLLSWMAINAYVLTKHPFDPYPFILLNLILSCLATLQAPVIMMSQNRQQAREKIQGDFEYETNLKSEIQIRSLHEKVDHLMISQWQRLMEIQQIQLELMQELAVKKVV